MVNPIFLPSWDGRWWLYVLNPTTNEMILKINTISNISKAHIQRFATGTHRPGDLFQSAVKDIGRKSGGGRVHLEEAGEENDRKMFNQ